MKEDNDEYCEVKRNLRQTIKELRDTIQNEDLPEQNFNLNVEEQSKCDAIVEREVTRVRAEIQRDILEKYYLYDVLKRECWDSVKTKSRFIKAFHLDVEVPNYRLKERTQKQLEDLRRVESMRKLEMAAALNDSKHAVTLEGQRDEQHNPESVSLTGSFSAQLGLSNTYIYDQFSVITTDQRINQIVLLQDVIHRIKTAFNAEFEALHRQKVQELKRVSDRNQRIGELMRELDMDEELWEPSMADSECPERLLTVDDSEIQAEKYLTPVQKKEEERRKREELAAQEDARRGKALDAMMDGVIEVQKVDILKREIPPPECLVPTTEEEKKAYEEYENKVKALNEAKETHKRSLEAEIKKLQNSTQEATKAIDESLTKLLEKKEKCTVAINQEELKITCLVESLLMDEEMRDLQLELQRKLEQMEAHKDGIVEEVKRLEEEVKVFHEVYDSVVAEDKILDKDFRKDFFDVPNPVVDVLYKLFKRRPWVQKMRAQIDNNPSLLQERRPCGSPSTDAHGKMLKAMEDLDAPENMPRGVNPSVWERFCVTRRAKVESEHQVKLKALTLAEMQAFLQRRRDEEQAAQRQIQNINEALESVHREKNDLLTDTMVQVIIKQGRVELPATDLTVHYPEVVLYHRTVADRLREHIRILGDEKLAAMEKRKDVRMGIIQQEWKNKVLREKMEDLYDKARSVKMLRLSEEQRDMINLSKKDQNSRMFKQICTLEKNLAFMEETHLKNVQQRIRTIEQINRRAARKAEGTALLERRLPDTQLRVAELRHICEPTAFEEQEEARAEERLSLIAKTSSLREVARAQGQTLAALRAEVERLTMRNFPALDQLKHH